MVGPTGSVVALNGELYNAAQLRARLRDRGHEFDGHSDTEVALHAYEEWSISFVEHIEGMFALAVWDPRVARLLLARDRMGIKPLYYAQLAQGEVLFASEIRALLPHLGNSRRLSLSGLMSYLATGAVVEPGTMIEGIRMLPPGHSAIVDADGLQLRQYWSLENAFQGRGSHASSQTVAQELREELEAAVRSQLVSDAPLAVFLSGGMDSSALVGLVSTVGESPPSTVSAVFTEHGYSEAKHIETVQKLFHTDHHEICLTGQDFLDHIPEMLRAMDQPTWDGVNTYVVSKVARQAGFTVVLSGLGGDELFGGYDHFRTIPRLKALRTAIPGPLTGLAATVGARRYGTSDRGRKLGRWLRGEAEDALILQRELFEPSVCAALLPMAAELSDRSPRTPIDDPINSISYGELSGYMRNVLLRDSDVMSMAHGLELRVPLLDDRVVEFTAKIPGHYKIARGQSKPLLATAVDDLLPQSVTARKKAGFVLPFEHWMRGPLHHEVQTKLLDESYGGAVAEILDAGAVGNVWRSYCHGTATWHRPWALYVLKSWGERHCSAAST